jgi:hypothetical protein
MTDMMATESTEKHGNISNACWFFPWIPWL